MNLRPILIEREIICPHLDHPTRLAFIKELGFLLYKYQTHPDPNQLELPMNYPRFRLKQTVQTELKLEDLDL